MSKFPEYVIRRILVALDASSQSIAALDEAAEMAVVLQAELIGMFVEDINLLRSASYPFVQRVSFPSGSVEPMDTGRMERELQAQSEQARRALAEAAERYHRPWSFRCVRGSVTAELLAAAGSVDVVMLGRAGWTSGRTARLGSTAAVMARSAPGAILIVEQPHAQRDPVLVLFDSAAGAARVLRTAAGYALVRAVGLVVFIPATDDSEFQRRLDEARQIADHRLRDIRFHRLEEPSPAALARAVATHGSGIMMLSGSSRLAADEAIRELVSRVSNPVLLIRDEQVSPGKAGQSGDRPAEDYLGRPE